MKRIIIFWAFVCLILIEIIYPPLVAENKGPAPSGYTVSETIKTEVKGSTVDVREFGAKGDGVTDDTGAIQAAINAVPAAGAVFFPSGRYVITSPLLFENKRGLTVFGTGTGFPTDRGMTKFVWEGNSKDPMFRLYGSRDCIFEKFYLESSSRKPLNVAIRLETRVLGLPSSNHTFRNIIIMGTDPRGLNKGFEFVAGTGKNANNDYMLFESVIVYNYTDVAYDITHSQSAAHVFLKSRFNGNRIAPSSTGVRSVPGVYFTWVGGGGGGNTNVDFDIGGSADPIYIANVLSENSNKFLKSGDSNKLLKAVMPSANYPIVIEASVFNSRFLGSDNRVIEFNERGPLVLIGFSVLGTQPKPAEIYFDSGSKTYAFSVIGARINTTLSNPFTGQPPTFQTGVLVGGREGELLPTSLSNVQGISGSVSSAAQARNLRGSVTISGTDTAGTFTFDTPEQDADYYLTVTPTTMFGFPAMGSNRIRSISKTDKGFTLKLESAPGEGSGVIFDWHLIR